jgi:hypothetical protein
MHVRAKFRCSSTESFGAGAARIFKFTAALDQDTPENQRFAKYTPCGSLQIHVDNPSVDFEIGKFYYLDFTPAN